VTSLALAAGCAIALAVPAAQAQVRSSWSGNPAANNAESREYMRLLQTNRSFRQARIRKECGPIADMQLRQNCMASFEEYTPFAGRTRLAGNNWNPPNARSAGTYDTQSGRTGGSTGTMSTTTTYGSEGYGAGYGTSVPASGNYPNQLNSYGASRNLPGEYSSGMIQSNGAMPNYPGPRPSGPLSGGGGGGGK